jgi:hypothetical protein
MTAVASELSLRAADGWPLGALLRLPAHGTAVAGVVTVPASRHERDGWTPTAVALADREVAVLQLDIRGRGSSAGHRAFALMGPAERRRVALDVAAAIDGLASVTGDGVGVGLLVEQDTAADALAAAAGDRRVGAIGVLSARSAGRCVAAVERSSAAVYAMVSSEDREGVRATVDAYLAASHPASKLEVFRGLGVGVTMASVLQFEAPGARPLEDRLATWLLEVLAEP